jgi:hypothetical protein
VRFRRGHQARVDDAAAIARFWSYVDRGDPEDCWPWLRNAHGGQMGYGRFKSRGVNRAAHRVAWELTNGPIPEGIFVCHHCDNPPCCNPAHLFLGTQAENLSDRDQKGRAVYKRGEQNGGAKLTEAQVLSIRQQVAAGDSQRSVATRLGVSQGLVQMIVRRKVWTHI